MVDRSETRSLTNKIDRRLQVVITSPYIQSQLHLVGLINRHGHVVSQNDYVRTHAPRKYQRRERETITPEIVLRALKNGEDLRRSRYRQSENASRRAAFNSFEMLSRRHRRQSHGSEKSREKSAPAYSSKMENGTERRSRVTSAFIRQSRDENDVLQPDQEEISIEQDRLHVSSPEEHCCEITMSYGLQMIASSAQTARDEAVVIQQHSTGENLVVYRGFLVVGECFSFESRRRSTSPLGLAFYTKGFIDSMVNDCCEFRFGRRNHRTNEHSQFLVQQIRNARPCEKCQTKYSRRALSPNVNNTAATTIPDTQSYKVRRRYLTLTPKLTIDNPEEMLKEKPNSNSKERHGNKKGTHHKRHSITNNSLEDIKDNKDKQITTDKSESVNFGLLELALIQQATPSEQLVGTESTTSSMIEENFARHKAELIQDNTSPTPSQQNRDVQEWVNQADVTPVNTHRSDGSISTVADTENMSRLSTANSRRDLQTLSDQIQSIDIARSGKNVENFIYILDDTIPLSDDERIKLIGLINSGLVFTHINDKTCTDYLTQTINEQIIMILSRASMEDLDRSLHDASQLRSIYIVDNTKDWSYDFEKIRGIYTDIDSVCNQLKTDIAIFTHDFTKILSISANDTNHNAFAYIQVLKDLLLETDETTNLKSEMLDFCRQEYAGNKIQLKYIDEFEHHFRADQAVKWYAREETFLFKMLSRAFRLLDPDILYKLRFFIQQLHRQLNSNLSTTSITVYRTQHISNDDFHMILKNQGGFLTFSNFLSTHKTKDTTQLHIAEQPFVNSTTTLVHFQIELDLTIPMREIELKNREEILITAATVFRIVNIYRSDKEIPIVKLTINNDVLQAVQEITQSLYEVVLGPFPLLRLAKLMKQMKYMQYLEYFCHMSVDNPFIVNNETANLTVGSLFHMLCCYYYDQKQYDRALEQLQTSLRVYLRVLSDNDIKLTPTYNNMGSIYHKQGLDDQALHFHKKAYDIQVQSSNSDLDSVASYAGNIASVLVKQGRYEDAIPYLQRDLQIRQRLYPNGNDIQLSTKYHNLAGAQFRAKKYHKALENYRKCLDIELKLHPSNHPTVAVTYCNMATVFEGLGRVKDAVETIRKAIERLLITKDENDQEVQMYKDYENRLHEQLEIV